MCESMGVSMGVSCCRLTKGEGDSLRVATIEVVVSGGLAATVRLDEQCQWWSLYLVEGATLKVSGVCYDGVMEPWK